MTDPIDDAPAGEDREISDVGLPSPGDPDDQDVDPVADDDALDEVFPAEGERS